MQEPADQSQAPVDDGMPPVDGNSGDVPPMPGNDGGNEFDTNFDAGVEADEDSDPKKYIQQLTGKLSQKLNSYNKDNNDPDLSKYVAGMIVSQAVKNLGDDDKKEIIDKIENGGGDDGENEMPDDGNMPPVDDNVPNPDGNNIPMDNQNPDDMNQQQQQPAPQNNFESVESSANMIDEILDNILNDDKDNGNKMSAYDDKSNKRKSYKTKPFIAKEFS